MHFVLKRQNRFKVKLSDGWNGPFSLPKETFGLTQLDLSSSQLQLLWILPAFRLHFPFLLLCTSISHSPSFSLLKWPPNILNAKRYSKVVFFYIFWFIYQNCIYVTMHRQGLIAKITSMVGSLRGGPRKTTDIFSV